MNRRSFIATVAGASVAPSVTKDMGADQYGNIAHIVAPSFTEIIFPETGPYNLPDIVDALCDRDVPNQIWVEPLTVIVDPEVSPLGEFLPSPIRRVAGLHEWVEDQLSEW